MADRQLDVTHVPINVTTQPGVAASAPQVTPVALGDVHLVNVELRIPPGHCGFTGIAVTLGGVSLLPWGMRGVWVIGDDDLLSFEVGVEVDTGLAVVTYNTGVYPHTHYLRFVWSTIQNQSQAAPLSLLPLDLLNGGAA